MNAFDKAIISLVKSGIGGQPVSLPEDFSWQNAMEILKEHKLLQLAYYGISNSKIQMPDDVKSLFMQFVFHNVCFDQRQQIEFENLQDKFNENKIKYMPLKGIILKKIYPHSEMRPMADIDVFINIEQLDIIKRAMNELGYELKKETQHEFRYTKNNFLIELHKSLIPDYDKDYYSYYSNGWAFAKKSQNSDTEYYMKKEDFFIYLIVHFAKHYRNGGISVLHLTDIWVYQRSFNLDYKYLKAELEKLSLYTFYLNINETIDCWFNNKKDSEMTDFITERMFNNGAWGTFHNRFISESVKNNKNSSGKIIKIKRMLNVIFPPASYLKFRYPILKKHSIFLPYVWVLRWIEALFKKRNNINSIAHSLRNTNINTLEKYKNELKYVGLDFDFLD